MQQDTLNIATVISSAIRMECHRFRPANKFVQEMRLVSSLRTTALHLGRRGVECTNPSVKVRSRSFVVTVYVTAHTRRSSSLMGHRFRKHCQLLAASGPQ